MQPSRAQILLVTFSKPVPVSIDAPQPIEIRILISFSDIRGLDLSRNLFQTWGAISEIVKELPFIRRLALKYVISAIISLSLGLGKNKYSRNRLPAPSSSADLAAAFENLEELQLNDTLLTWRDMQVLMTAMPGLKIVELGYNQLSRLSSEDQPAIPPHPTLQSLNLDSNFLSDWVHVCFSLALYERYLSI
jgi:hypothetical protein